MFFFSFSLLPKIDFKIKTHTIKLKKTLQKYDGSIFLSEHMHSYFRVAEKVNGSNCFINTVLLILTKAMI